MKKIKNGVSFFTKNKGKLPMKTSPNWDKFQKDFKSVTREDLSSVIINGKINKGTMFYIASMDKDSKQTFCIQLMSLPEYQMC